MKDGEQVRKGSSMEMDIMDDSGYEGCWSRLWVRRSDFVKMIGSDDAFIYACPMEDVEEYIDWILIDPT